ncbi:MAG: hypothetical protein WA906_13565, partial [Pacificimonas sp.]
ARAALADRPEQSATYAIDADLEAHGWTELIEQSRTGVVSFEGGLLAIVPTPAGTTIDIDGELSPVDLAAAGVAAAARAICRLGLGGSILIDIPGVTGKAERQAVAERFDDVMTPPFERTAINGFGLLQVVRPRLRPSLMELVQNRPAESGGLDLLRRAERAAGVRSLELRAGQAVRDWLAARPQYLATLERIVGAHVALKAHGSHPLWWGDVHGL